MADIKWEVSGEVFLQALTEALQEENFWTAQELTEELIKRTKKSQADLKPGDTLLPLTKTMVQSRFNYYKKTYDLDIKLKPAKKSPGARQLEAEKLRKKFFAGLKKAEGLYNKEE